MFPKAHCWECLKTCICMYLSHTDVHQAIKLGKLLCDCFTIAVIKGSTAMQQWHSPEVLDHLCDNALVWNRPAY